MGVPLSLPEMPVYIQQLAGILPLTALVEFIDLPTKLHGFHLTGRVQLWNWAITPAGARLLLQTRDNENACCLDSFDRSATLHCIDGRFGDLYPSSTPTTTRLWLGSLSSAVDIPNPNPRMRQDNIRKQKLEVIVVLKDESHVALQQAFEESRLPFWRALFKTDRAWWSPLRFRLLSLLGWLLWCLAVATSLASGLYIAAAYLLLLPLTGLAVKHSHGGPPRKLLDGRMTEYKRVVVATNSLNGSDWWLFYGGSTIVNSLLNKPLNRAAAGHGGNTNGNHTPRSQLVMGLLQLCIVSQWGLAVASCAFQDWNAIIVSAWLAFCACSSAYLYPARDCVRDWLELDCKIRAVKIRAEFSSRRSLLGAMVLLNPDTKTSLSSTTNWMNPILSPCDERTQWETALLKYIDQGCMFFSSAPLIVVSSANRWLAHI